MNDDVLALLIREEAPVPRAEFVDVLDARVAGGFRALPPSSREVDPIWPWMPALTRLARRLRLRVLVPVATVAVAIAVVGIGVGTVSDERSVDQGGSGSSESPYRSGVDQSGDLATSDYEAVPMIGDAPSHSTGGGTSTVTVAGTVTDPRTYLLGSGIFLAVEPDEVPGVVADATQLARDLGGYPGSTSFDVDGDRADGSADLWVPTDRVPDATARLAKLGRVERTTQRSRDISSSRASLVNQIVEDRRQLERIEDAGPYDAEDTASNRRFEQTRDAVENQLTLRRQRLANLDKRVDMTLINLKVTGRAEPSAPARRWSIEWAVDRASTIFRATVSVAIVGLAALLVPALALGAGWLAARAVRRRRRDSVLDGD